MNLRLDINITGLDRIADAVLAIAQGSAGRTADAPGQAGEVRAASGSFEGSVSGTPAPVPAASAVQTAQVAPAVAPTAQVPQAPSAPVTPPPAAVPVPQAVPVQTAQVTYSMDDLATAASTLLDSGRMAELQNLLRSFGVESLPALPQEQYGAFATALRGMGARI